MKAIIAKSGTNKIGKEDGTREELTRERERLTIWNGRRWILKQGKTSDGGSYWRMTTDKLAAYENTGLEPDEVARVIAEYKSLTGEAM